MFVAQPSSIIHTLWHVQSCLMLSQLVICPMAYIAKCLILCLLSTAVSVSPVRSTFQQLHPKRRKQSTTKEETRNLQPLSCAPLSKAHGAQIFAAAAQKTAPAKPQTTAVAFFSRDQRDETVAPLETAVCFSSHAWVHQLKYLLKSTSVDVRQQFALITLILILGLLFRTSCVQRMAHVTVLANTYYYWWHP